MPQPGDILAGVQQGYLTQAEFDAHPDHVLKKGQIAHLLQTGTYKLGDGVTELQDLVFIGAGGGDVESVNGQTGIVVLYTGDINEVSDRNYQTDEQQTNNNATSPIQEQIDSKAPINNAHLTGTLTTDAAVGSGDRMVQANTDGDISAVSEIIDDEITDSTIITQITTGGNWTGVNYTGSAITGLYKGQSYADGTYYYLATADNTIIRFARA